MPLQEKILKKLIDLHKKLNPTPSNWKREAGLRSRMVDLTMELYIGDPRVMARELDALSRFAHLARDKDLVRKAMDKWKQLAEENKLDSVHRCYEVRERDMAEWSAEFNSNNAPEKREIDTVLISKQYE